MFQPRAVAGATDRLHAGFRHQLHQLLYRPIWANILASADGKQRDTKLRNPTQEHRVFDVGAPRGIGCSVYLRIERIVERGNWIAPGRFASLIRGMPLAIILNACACDVDDRQNTVGVFQRVMPTRGRHRTSVRQRASARARALRAGPPGPQARFADRTAATQRINHTRVGRSDRPAPGRPPWPRRDRGNRTTRLHQCRALTEACALRCNPEF